MNLIRGSGADGLAGMSPIRDLDGDGVILAQGATLGGHVQFGDFAALMGLAAVHQYCRVGRFAFIGGLSAVVADVIPNGSALGVHAHLAGLNVIGLRRRNFSRDLIHDLRAAYRLLFAEEGTFQERVEDVASLYGSLADTYDSLPLSQKPAVRLEEYVTEKTVDGVFKMLAKEEERIRADPAARTSELLRRVFR